MAKGIFITFEGIDGAGKSSHIQPTAELLKASGYEVVVTREPGGTDLAEKLRQLILNDAMDPMTEALLVFAARRDHIQRVIRPALEAGKVVLSDRFTDSTWAYQGYGRGFNHHVLDQLEDWVQRDHLDAGGGGLLQPDATFLYDLDPAIAARRLAGAREPDRFESEKADFFNKVRQGYLLRMANHRGRFYRLDASKTQDEVWAEVKLIVDTMIGADQIVTPVPGKVANADVIDRDDLPNANSLSPIPLKDSTVRPYLVEDIDEVHGTLVNRSIDARRLHGELLKSAEMLFDGSADNFDVNVAEKNPTGCFLDSDTQSVFYELMPGHPPTRLDASHKSWAVLLAAAVLEHTYLKNDVDTNHVGVIMSEPNSELRPLKQRKDCLGCLVRAKNMQGKWRCALGYPLVDHQQMSWLSIPAVPCPKPQQQKHKPCSQRYTASISD